MTRRVMFVDDEPNVLDGLRRVLRPLRHEWDMQFATGGAAALVRLAAAPVDVLVTDMRMPGMDGDQLLAVVRERFPNVVRFVLTGQCTREAMLRLVPLAHRVLNKPCDPDELEAAVRRACVLQDLLRNPTLADLVGRPGGLSPPPVLYTRILAELARPGGSVAEIGNLIAQDGPLVAKLMQAATSAGFALGRPPGGPAQAVHALGMETTKALVLVSDAFTRYDPAALRPDSIGDLWDHSLGVAALAGRIAYAEAGAGPAAEARLAGLLHDIGRLALAGRQPERYRHALRLAREPGSTVAAAERQVFGVTHAEVGAYLIGGWGLANRLVDAVAWHHTPAAGGAGGAFGPLTAVHAAEAILAPDEAGGPDAAYLGGLGLDGRFGRWAGLHGRTVAGGEGT